MYVLGIPKWNMPNECLSEAGEEEGFESFLLLFDVACGLSAQRQGLPAKDQRTTSCHEHFFVMS